MFELACEMWYAYPSIRNSAEFSQVSTIGSLSPKGFPMVLIFWLQIEYSMDELEQSEPARIKFRYNEKDIAHRYGGPVPRVGERINIRGKDIRHDGSEGVRQFVVQDILYLLDDHSLEEDEVGMLVHVTLSAARKRHWYVENEE